MLPLTAGLPGRRADLGRTCPTGTARGCSPPRACWSAALRFTGLLLLPVDFPYWLFALLIFGNGVGSGLFASPNTSAIMSSVPADHRGPASGMRVTFQNSGMSLSIGIFFSLMIAGLAATLPQDADQRAAPRRACRRDRHAGRPPAAGQHPVRRPARL